MFAKRESEVRRPTVAGAFYPRGAQELKSTVEALLSQATKRELSGLCGVVAPHAGYVYSGQIAGEAFSLLARSSDGPNRILLIGPPHYVPVRGIVAPSSGSFATPYVILARRAARSGGWWATVPGPSRPWSDKNMVKAPR